MSNGGGCVYRYIKQYSHNIYLSKQSWSLANLFELQRLYHLIYAWYTQNSLFVILQTSYDILHRSNSNILKYLTNFVLLIQILHYNNKKYKRIAPELNLSKSPATSDECSQNEDSTTINTNNPDRIAINTVNIVNLHWFYCIIKRIKFVMTSMV